MNDIFMNFASVLRLSGRTGGIQNSISGCGQELRNIAYGLQLGHGGEGISETLSSLSDQCSEQSLKVSRMGSTLQEAARIMRSAEEKVIQNNSLTNVQKALQGRYKKAVQSATAAAIAGGGMRAGGGYGGDPVSMFSGSFLWQITPLQTYAGEPLSLTIYYDTVHTKDEGLGSGFRHNFMSCIQLLDDGIRGVFFGDGSSIFFGEGEDKIFYSQNPSTKRLEYKEEGFWYYDFELLTATEYDKKGRATAEYRQGKEIRRLIYEGERLSKVQAVHGYSYDFIYKSEHLAKIIDNAGRYVELEYNNNLLLKLTICLEPEALFKEYDHREYHFFYDERGYLTKITAPDGNPFFENTYDEKGRVVHQSMGKGRFFDFAYEGNKTTNRDETGFTTKYIHDERGNLLLMENPLLKYEAEYDLYDRIIKKTVNDTDVVLYDYNAFGQLTSVVKGEFSHEFFYEENHKLEEYTFNGRRYLKIHYDLSGNVVVMNYHGEEIHQFFYDEENRLAGYEAQGESCRLSYNERGLIAKTYAPEEFSEEYTYDEIGRITNVKIGNGREVNLGYAFEDLIAWMEDDLGRNISCTYSLRGAILSYKDGERDTICVYDASGNLIELNIPGEDIHNMEYDNQGNLLSHYKGDFLLECLTYDENYRVVKAVDGFGYEESYIWNIWNQPVKITNSNGLVVDIVYDENHFLKELSMDGFHINYQYDKEGRLSYVSDDAGRYGIYEYDMADRLVQVNTFLSQIELTYDNFSNITLISMADFGYLLQNGYDAYNRPTEGKVLGEPFYRLWYGTRDIERLEIAGETIDFRYDRAGRAVTLINYFGKKIEKKFDQYDGLISVGAIELKDNISYGYDLAGRIKWVRDEDGRAAFFSSDGMGTLVGVYYRGAE